jgi:glycerol-3-phosphate dehydrogenase (NAD(P)+)
MSRVTIVGDGGWGTALGMVLARNGHAVRIWGPFAEYIATIQQTGENAKFLPGVALPEALDWTADDGLVGEAEAVVLAVPSRFYAEVVTRLQGALAAVPLVVSVTKGFAQDGHRRMSETANALLGREDGVVVLSGPSHAEEVARGVPTAVVAACRQMALAEATQALFTGAGFRVYTSDDTVGVELGGALKNVIAIAAGICDGIGYGDNTKAALMTRGLAEMARLGAALGAQPATFSGLSGMGDLIVTCGSALSRNRRVGELLGRGETLAAILARTEQVAEGVWNCTHAKALAEQLGVDAPIMTEVHAIVHEGKSPRDAVNDLLARDPRPERDDDGARG